MATMAQQQPGSMTNSFESANGPSTRNVKAEAFGDAHKQRVESEVSAWLMSEIRKAEARAATAESKVEQKRMKDEARAAEHKKREESKAEQSIRAAEIKAEKIVANAKEEAVRMKAHAKEECEKAIATSHTEAERAKAEQEEIKRREIAELKDKAEQMKISGELPFYEKEKRGMGTKVKHALACHHGS
ncbi:hypothetical protein M758_4G078700 [Ceratodon purpureus]|uniref:Uncharacterized protein n=1 Tax=Ceratodon purpureus TaxID=3225 RepID=A0A8T0I8Y8_CERPU|nr:hypothetical protein KC19_4G078600 [Ceratodon purpureus]KAG0618619.1 hypothetical protein M758_4G078700 [Ceratodon purpureus]